MPRSISCSCEELTSLVSGQTALCSGVGCGEESDEGAAVGSGVVINLPGSSLEYPRYSQEYLTTSPLPRPEEVVLTVSDGSLDASERTAE